MIFEKKISSSLSLQGRVSFWETWDLRIILFLSGLSRLLATFFSEGFNHPDELFSILEPAYGLVHGYSLKAWEWQEGIRSYFVPYLYSFLIRAGEFLGLLHPSSLMIFIRGCTAFFSLLSVYCIFQLGLLLANNRHVARWSAILMGLWWVPVYFSVRTMSEPLSVNFILCGYLVAVKVLVAHNLDAKKKGPLSVKQKWMMFFSGLLLGISFCIRFQCGLFAIALFLVLLIQGFYSSLILMSTGVLLAVLGQGTLDLVTWGTFLQSPIEYFRWNVIDGGAARVFGENPWHRYITWLIRYFTLPGALVLLFFSAKTMKVKKLLILWLPLFLFWGVHQILSHKEDRFLIPMIPFLFLVFSYGFVHWYEKRRNFSMVLVILILLGGNAYKIRKHRWNHHKDVTDAFVRGYENPSIKGLLVYGSSLSHSGGHFYLHKNIPLQFLSEEKPALATLDSTLQQFPHTINFILPFTDPAPLIEKLKIRGVRCAPEGEIFVKCL